MSCHIYTNLVRKQGHFHVNPSSCMVERRTHEGMVLRDELQTLASDPLIWHGNGKIIERSLSVPDVTDTSDSMQCHVSSVGAGKQVYLTFGYQSFKCLLAKRNMTEADHLQTYG